MIVLCNAFSLNMLAPDMSGLNFSVARVTVEHARAAISLGFTSAVGHAETADVFASVLGVPVPHARVNVVLRPEAELLVGQYVGVRLPEGATSLPEGARIDWFVVVVG